jgi:hypothetical protein
MDQRQYSTLLEAVADVPDPRQARGKQHAWAVILTVIALLWFRAIRVDVPLGSGRANTPKNSYGTCARSALACRVKQP